MRGGPGGGGGGWMRIGVDEEDRISAKDAGKVVRRSLRMLRPYRRQVVVACVVMVAFTLATLAGPFLVRYGTDVGLGGGDLEKADRGALYTAVVAYLCAAVAALVLSRVQIQLVTRVGESFLRDLRVRVFRHLLRMSQSFYDRERTGRLVARMTSDIDSLQELVQQGLVMFINNGLVLFVAVIVLVVMAPQLAVVCLIALPIVIAASVRFRNDSNKAYLEVRDRISQTLSTLQEGIAGVRVIQAFAQEEGQIKRFRRHNRAQLDANMTATKISARYFPVIEMAGIGTTAAVVGIGGILVHRDAVTVGTVVAFVLYLGYLFEPVQQLSQLFNTLQSAGASLHKLFGLLDTPVDVPERAGAVDLPETGDLVVDGVSFAYGGDGSPTVLSEVSVTVPHGERIALVGPTGAGKSTLAKLMARLYDPVTGSISYGGVDLRDCTFSSLRERICVVPQEGYLFYGSIVDNVRLGRAGASDDEVAEAMRSIGVHDRFASLPEGLATEVRERGSRLSAGERQLVSLARAALANPKVLVLDEATSNLDPGTESDVERALDALMEGRTVIVIAHRLSTAQRADRVAVVDAGGIVELGTHDELVAHPGGRYAALFASWTGGLTVTP